MKRSDVVNALAYGFATYSDKFYRLMKEKPVDLASALIGDLEKTVGMLPPLRNACKCGQDNCNSSTTINEWEPE